MYQTAARPFANFQLHPAVNCTAEKMNMVQISPKLSDDGKLTIQILIVHSSPMVVLSIDYR
jgi:hypothetical protein